MLVEYDKGKSTLYSNGLVALMTSQSPAAVVMSTADNPGLIETAMTTTDRCDRDYSATKGLASAILRYDVKLRPAGSERIFFISPLSAVKQGARDLSFTTHEESRDISIERWFKFSGKRSAGTYPERDFDEVLSQAKASLAMQAHTTLLSQESTMDWRARARIILALERAGCHDLAIELCLKASQKFDIKESSADGSILGPLIWGILQPIEDNSTNGFLKKISPYVENAIGVLLEAIISELEDDKALRSEPVVEESIDVLSTETEELANSPLESEGTDNVLDDEASTEVEAPAVEPLPLPEPWTLSELNEAIWNLAALQTVSAAFKSTWNEKTLVKLDQAITDYSELIDTKLSEMPSFSELELTDAYSLDLLELLSAVSQLRLYNLDEKILKEVVKIVSGKVTSKGLVRLSGPPVRFSSHLSLWLAHYYTRKKMRDDAEILLRKSLEFLSDYNVLPEWVNPRTGGGSSGNGCSIHAAANLLLLLRDMMLYTEGNNLIVFPGVPEEWYTSKYPLIVSNIPTSIGPVYLEIGASKNQHQIEVRLESLPEEIEFRLPSTIPISIVKVYGGGVAERSNNKNFPYVRVVPLSESIVLTFRK
jgi:tetratricopeptide (TPR) repeat protein